MTRERTQTIVQLDRLGIRGEDARALLRASATLHTWAEHECNGAIQRDEFTEIPYWHNTYSGKRICRTSDREAGAIKRVKTIAARYGLTPYIQGDPRGCSLYLLRPDDVPPGADIGSYYNRGVAVCS